MADNYRKSLISQRENGNDESHLDSLQKQCVYGSIAFYFLLRNKANSGERN